MVASSSTASTSTHERVHEALLTLADGHVGTSGASLAPHRNQHPWVVAAGVYDGDGADSHLLTGPRAFELTGMADGAPVLRILDLPYGVLHERIASDGQLFDSVRFASLGRAEHVGPTSPVSEGRRVRTSSGAADR